MKIVQGLPKKSASGLLIASASCSLPRRPGPGRLDLQWVYFALARGIVGLEDAEIDYVGPLVAKLERCAHPRAIIGYSKPADHLIGDRMAVGSSDSVLR